MRDRVYWCVLTCVFALVAHFGYLGILFYAGMPLASKKDPDGFEIRGTSPAYLNKTLFWKEGPGLLYGTCFLDLRRGPWGIRIQLPHRYWLLAFYSLQGRPLYTTDYSKSEKKAEFLVEVEGRALPPLEKILFQGYSIVLPEDRVLAVLRIAAPRGEEVGDLGDGAILECGKKQHQDEDASSGGGGGTG